MRRRRYRRPQPKPVIVQKLRVNNFIQAPEVRLIGPEGENFGVVSREEAIEKARSFELDVVEVSPKAVPPVCRIIDYGKFQYKEMKQAQQKRANQKKVDTKGIRLGLRTDTHDLEFKRAQAEKFLGKGHKVKIELVLRGREKAMGDKAKENLVAFLALIKIPYKTEEEVKRFMGGFQTIIAPA